MTRFIVGVFDGHSGTSAPSLCVDQMAQRIADAASRRLKAAASEGLEKFDDVGTWVPWYGRTRNLLQGTFKY